jgi:LysR family cyn operon transcriptional activator
VASHADGKNRPLSPVAQLFIEHAALKTGEVGVLRVGATPQVIESLLADFLLRYRKRHAGVEVHLVEDCGARLPGRLGRGDIDVAVMPAGEDAFAADCFFRFMRWRSCRNTIV